MSKKNINTIIFDLGGVLIDWNPEYLYTKIFEKDPKKIEWFLSKVCTPEWNMEQDAGRTLQMGTELLIEEFPDYKKEIFAFYDRWEEMLAGEIKDTVHILKELKSLNKAKLYALTNWSIETFPIALERYDFLKLFEGIVVSGEENTRKPHPKIYNIALERYNLLPENCLFIDDSLANVNGAINLNINSLHYTGAVQLRTDLTELGLI